MKGEQGPPGPPGIPGADAERVGTLKEIDFLFHQLVRFLEDSIAFFIFVLFTVSFLLSIKFEVVKGFNF